MGLLNRLRDLFTRPAAMPATKKEPFDLALLEDASPEAVEMKPALTELLPQLLGKSYGTKLNELPAYQAIRAQDSAYQSRLVLALAAAINRVRREDDYRIRWGLAEVLTALLRTTLTLQEADYLRLFASYGLDFAKSKEVSLHIYPFPLLLTLTQVAKLAKRKPLGEPMLDFLRQLRDRSAGQTGDLLKIHLKTQEILGQVAGSDALPIVVFSDADPLGQALSQFVASLDRADPRTAAWLGLLQRWPKATAAHPTAKLRKELDAATAAIGADAVRQQGRAWLQVLADTPVTERQHVHDYGNGTNYTYSTWDFITESNATVAKGLIWTLQPLADPALLELLTALAAKCFRKIPGKGPLAAGLGNACLLALSQNGLPGVAALARVRSKIRQTNTQETIARYIAQESQKLGVSPAEIEDMAAPDFGLENGRLVEEYGDYTATLTLADGKAEVQWQKADKPLKSAPSALKTTHPDELKELKAAQTQAQQTYTAQRDRLDRSFVEERRIPWPWFEQYYFRHGLLSLLARPLIWRLHHPGGTFQDALYLGGSWQDAQGQPVSAPTTDTQLQLWHPVLVPAAEVLSWRRLLEEKQIRQPLKQAFREVYLLTPPEERTSTYSNRMAAHILKQHQFNSLAKLRGWRYRLLGAYDKGYDSETASLPLPTHDLTAEFWVSEVYADGEWNDTGIYNYVSTDQVRFTRADAPVPLPQIPPLVFSEVMRDVDLFVGVASVGNDPQWRDNGGLAQFRNYWESYSFGDLSEVAKTRKMALERLVPRLKIGKASEIKGNFLVVKGHRHTYKIHLGSGNILMEPNDQYLCIVPERSAKTMGAADVFLPFEGDAVLSIILSKALLLMDDDKITDQTILRQL
ncbi:DUF4132 domain-containing protein [Hymenobacter sediminicola]|uniref:DUF4132 domain-containing protein n=1 Tax=Hymenobacter sediminicola TaxID=2761579 RepID=A0A7G7W9N1_9BACT|nr:DUF4132 domain-containing protein [Hymenobacter sediminicola]QNH63074.1 DUF4132 domain-containing protein [Hymenobacter sediminicola]